MGKTPLHKAGAVDGVCARAHYVYKYTVTSTVGGYVVQQETMADLLFTRGLAREVYVRCGVVPRERKVGGSTGGGRGRGGGQGTGMRGCEGRARGCAKRKQWERFLQGW